MRSIAAIVLATLLCSPTLAAEDVTYIDQGGRWTDKEREDFYFRDQGSRLIPLRWLAAFKNSDGSVFLDDGLSRYGYISHPSSHTSLPIGFTVSGPSGNQIVGMTCAACHTRQIIAKDVTYRIDGAPAIVDFQSFLFDLDKAAGKVVANDASFNAFAASVLANSSPPPADVLSLRKQFDAWYLRYHEIISRALPDKPWGPSRLDAVGMIFDRVTGLDIGPGPSHLISDNIKKADAPARYPFLWNASRQDKTQWPGFAGNGTDTLALGRNLGEVFGVFAVFVPRSETLSVNYLNQNSANFDGLARLEELIKRLGPPKWPWPVDVALAERGREIFNDPAKGACKQCHGVTLGQKPTFGGEPLWKTPIQNVGTDTRQGDILLWKAKSGVLKGAYRYGTLTKLNETDLALNILATSVIGSIAQSYTQVDPLFPTSEVTPASDSDLPPELPPALSDLAQAFPTPNSVATPASNGSDVNCPSVAKGCYEARVLEGIWAAAPYLHNGSVPSLAELLKPAAERAASFSVGPNYDADTVGLASTQTKFDYTMQTTDCSDLNSGNSRCGHDFGTWLPENEKKALLEYLKTL